MARGNAASLRPNYFVRDGSGSLLGDHRGLAGNVEALAAAHILAGHHVVFANHVGSKFGEAGAVALVGTAAKLVFLGAHHPGHFIFRRLVTVGTVQRSQFLLLLLVKKIALFHKFGAGDVQRRAPDQLWIIAHLTRRAILKRRSRTPQGTLMSSPGTEPELSWPERKKRSAFEL
jgi:hypothetical protein